MEVLPVVVEVLIEARFGDGVPGHEEDRQRGVGPAQVGSAADSSQPRREPGLLARVDADEAHSLGGHAAAHLLEHLIPDLNGW